MVRNAPAKFLTVITRQQHLSPIFCPSTGLKLLFEYTVKLYCSVLKPEMDVPYLRNHGPWKSGINLHLKYSATSLSSSKGDLLGF